MQGMVDEARKYLESEQGQQFEQGLQNEFLGNKKSAGQAGQSSPGDSTDPSSGSYGNNNSNDGPQSEYGSGSQLRESDTGSNTAGGNDYDETSSYNQAGREQQNNDGPYTSEDTSSSGGYGTTNAGDSFSDANQNGTGDQYGSDAFASSGGGDRTNVPNGDDQGY